MLRHVVRAASEGCTTRNKKIKHKQRAAQPHNHFVYVAVLLNTGQAPLPGGQKYDCFANISGFSRAFECAGREVEIRVFVFNDLGGGYEWVYVAQEVDLPPVGSIWKGFDTPAESQHFAKCLNARGVLTP